MSVNGEDENVVAETNGSCDDAKENDTELSDTTTKRSRVERSQSKDKSPSPPAKKPKSEKSRKDRDDDRTEDKEHKERDSGRKKERRRGKSRSRSRSRSRSHSPSSKKRRSDRHEKEKKKSSRSHGEREKDSDKRKTEPETEHQDEYEDGEVPDAPRVLTARELERQRIMEEELAKGEDDGEEPVWSMRRAQKEKDARSCPFLDTIDRSVLDFDFEKFCSVSLSTLNVYACMVCGKYFQGRGTNTHAYTHSLDTDHRVFLNLLTLRFYCLPDNYEITDPSLEDIKYVLKPTYSKELIASLDRQTRMARAYDDSMYYPGVVGLNNIKANDYCNVVLAALSHVTPLRNYFLQEQNYTKLKRPPGDKMTELPKRFGELVRKIWNPKAFRKHVSPHEMLQATVLCSEKKFQFIKQGDAAEYMNFLLNSLHVALNGTNKTNSSVIYKTFRGRMRQYSRKVIPAEATEDQRRQLLQLDEYKESSKEIPFLYLTLDLPPAPLYRDQQMENIIPQVPLHVLMGKFNGTTEKEYKTYNENIVKRFELLRLPDYLLITYKRFHKNQWFVEKNPTIVNFPISNVDFHDCLVDEAKPLHKYTTYDLIANVVHEGRPEDGSYRVQLAHQGSEKWFELEDLHVKEILPQMIVLAESYIQVWRLNKTKTREERLSEGTETEEEMAAAAAGTTTTAS